MAVLREPIVNLRTKHGFIAEDATENVLIKNIDLRSARFPHEAKWSWKTLH